MIHVADHSLLTSAEVAVHLRICESDAGPDEVARAVRAVHRLVRDKKLRPIKPAKTYIFAMYEVNRYVKAETESFESQENAHEKSH